MTLQQLKVEAARLPAKDLNDLANFIDEICEIKDLFGAEELGELRRDTDPTHWVTFEAVKAELGTGECVPIQSSSNPRQSNTFDA